MNKRDFYIRAMQLGCYRHLGWVIDAFAMTELRKEPPKEPYPCAVWRQEDGYYCFHPDSNEVERLEGTEHQQPAFYMFDEISLDKGDCPNVSGPINTTYGNLIYNWIVLVYPFGDKIPFMADEIKISTIEKIIERKFRDTPPEGEARDPRYIYVEEFLRYQDATHYTEGFTQLCVPSATPVNVITDPKISERRAELLTKYKDQLHDPAVVIKITDELIDMDKRWVATDPESGYYTNPAKQFNVARKKMFIMQGIESGFSDSPGGTLIETSLDDGWDISKLPAMANSLREGSFYRGAQTALGGEIVKTLLRISQNSTIAEVDCGVKFGMMVHLRTPDIAKKCVDRHYIENGKIIYIDDKVAESLVGKTIELRSPIYCKTGGYNYCSTCMGVELSKTPKALSVYVSDVGSAFLNAFLKKMHGVSAAVAKYDIADSLT